MMYSLNKIIAISNDPISQVRQNLVCIFNQEEDLLGVVLESFSTSLKKLKSEPVIQDKFIEKLVISLDQIHNLTLTGLSLKKAFKISNILIENIPDLLLDTELNLSTKDMLLSQLTTTTNLLIDMMNDRKNFMKLGDTDLIKEFFQISQIIKRNLLQTINADAKGLRWNPREENLWRWCRTMLEHTVHPDYRLLLSHAQIDPNSKTDIITKFQTLHNIQTKTIMEIAFSDDVADNLSNKKLTEILVSIPFGQPSILIEHRDFLSTYQNGIFLNYFNLAVEVWNNALTEFKELIGESLYPGIEPEFKEHYKKIMGAITYSLDMNLFPHKEGRTSDIINQHLPANMMVECFRFMEKMLVTSLEHKYPHLKISETEKDIELKQSIIQDAQLVASLSNSAATFYRELRESDITNVLFFIVNEHKLTELNMHGIEFKNDFIAYQKEYKFENHFFELYGIPKDLFDLIQTKNIVQRNTPPHLRLLRDEGIDFSELTTNDVKGHILEVLMNAETTLKSQQMAEDVLLTLNLLKRVLAHLELIDGYIKKSVLESNIMSDCANKITSLLDNMKTQASQLSTLDQQKATQEFIESWTDFFGMYLIFKYQTRGAI